MSQLQLLKSQIELMDKKICEIVHEIETKETLIHSIKSKKAEIDQQLIDEESKYNKLTQNHSYLCEVKKDTSDNYNQIEEAALTLLDIIKTKCDSIA